MGSPTTCSGDMYSGVPRTMPLAVSFLTEAAILARPKSARTGVPSGRMRMFEGLMSRWSTPTE